MPQSLPSHGGLGLKPEHYRDVLESNDRDLWVEVHPENYMVDGGPRLSWLAAIRQNRALSFHGVGASLGGVDPLDKTHLAQLADLVQLFQPEQISEHAAWCAHDGIYYSDLLPLPRTTEAMANLVNHIDEFQNALGRTILIENPSNYLPFASEMDEPDFLNETAQRAGCGLLLDVNNVWVSAHNVGGDPQNYIRKIAPALVGEIHVAGHTPDPDENISLLIDSHGAPVSEDVWALLDFTLKKMGPKPVLVERDADIPAFALLKAERDRAHAIVCAARERADAA